MNSTHDRLCIPQIPVEDFVQAVKELVSVEKDWVPSEPDTSLYIRPFTIATEPVLGVKASSEYKFIIICSPSGAYYEEGMNPVKIYVEDEYVRATPGGTGYIKCGGNYAASIIASEKAHKLALPIKVIALVTIALFSPAYSSELITISHRQPHIHQFCREASRLPLHNVEWLSNDGV